MSWRTPVLEYIGDDYSKCLYLYINLNKYGFNNSNFNVWVSLDDNGEINALMAKYYTGIHIYSHHAAYALDDIVEFIGANNPSIITGTGQIINHIQEYLPEYEAEFGSVGQIKNVVNLDSSNIEIASIDDMYEISRLLIEDEGLGGHYDATLLEHQLKERHAEGFGRNYVVKSNGTIISHCATYAQTNQLGVTSGLFTKPEERGKGYAYSIYCKLCSDLLREGKEVFAYYYTFQAHKMHEKVGFEIVSSWAKLVKTSD